MQNANLVTFCGPRTSRLKTSFHRKICFRKSTGLSHPGHPFGVSKIQVLTEPYHNKSPNLTKGAFIMEGQRGLGHILRPRHNIFANKFARVGSLANCHRQFSPQTPFGVSGLQIPTNLSQEKDPILQWGFFLGGPAGT